MDSLYTDEIRRYIFTRDWPKDKAGNYRVRVDILEAYDPEPHLNLIFFRDNWLTLTFEEQAQATSIVKEIMFKLWNDGVPIYTGKMESQYYEQES